MMQYHFKIYKEPFLYWAECIELEGCNTQGNTKNELLKHMKEALDLYLDEPENSRLITPRPQKGLKGRNIVEISVDPHVAWASALRNARMRRGMTQKDVAKSLDFKSVYAYQKLESSKTANPEYATIVKIKKVFPELDLEDLLSA
jgi:antitoxin HicB